MVLIISLFRTGYSGWHSGDGGQVPDSQRLAIHSTDYEIPLPIDIQVHQFAYTIYGRRHVSTDNCLSLGSCGQGYSSWIHLQLQARKRRRI